MSSSALMSSLSISVVVLLTFESPSSLLSALILERCSCSSVASSLASLCLSTSVRTVASCSVVFSISSVPPSYMKLGITNYSAGAHVYLC